LNVAILKEQCRFISMRPKGSADRLEYRRQLATRLLREGKGVNEVARLVDASPSSVSRWKEAYHTHGEEGLKAKPHPGRGAGLSDADKEHLVALLLAGPVAAGYDTELWTCARVAQVIERNFGITYHPSHVWKILRSLGWSCQFPEQQGRERDEAAIKQWREQEWPRIKKKRGKKTPVSP